MRKGKGKRDEEWKEGQGWGMRWMFLNSKTLFKTLQKNFILKIFETYLLKKMMVHSIHFFAYVIMTSYLAGNLKHKHHCNNYLVFPLFPCFPSSLYSIFPPLSTLFPLFTYVFPKVVWLLLMLLMIQSVRSGRWGSSKLSSSSEIWTRNYKTTKKDVFSSLFN